MNRKEKVNGYIFELVDDEFYQCRGDVCYDDEHDEVPEDGLWTAAHELREKLNNQGVNCDVEYSEKGWVEVVIL